MADFEDVQHTGGAITIRRRGSQYQLSYVHMRPVRSTLVELFVKADGTPIAFSPITGIGLQPAPEPEFMVMFASDEEGLFGQQCPKCESYFRSREGSVRISVCGRRLNRTSHCSVRRSVFFGTPLKSTTGVGAVGNRVLCGVPRRPCPLRGGGTRVWPRQHLTPSGP